MGRAVGSEEWCGLGDSVDDVVCSSAAGSRGIRIEGEVAVLLLLLLENRRFPTTCIHPL